MKIDPTKPVLCYYRLSKTEQANENAIASHLFQLQKGVEEAGGVFDMKNVYSDIRSGRDSRGRDGFNALTRLIREGVPAAVVVRLDRMSRDARMFFELSDLFEKTGVLLYDLVKGRFIDFRNPDDWADYHKSGIQAEQESRTISRRIKMQREFMRSQGKVQGGRCPHGYRRNSQGKYEPNLKRDRTNAPATWDEARKLVEQFLETRSTVQTAKYAENELGLSIGYQGLDRWLRNEVLRGHTPYLRGDDRDRAHNKRKGTEIRYNTHEALISPQDARQIDLILANARRFRGRSLTHKIYPLSGLIRCSICGDNCTLSTNDKFAYAYCASYRAKTWCGDRTLPKTKRVGIRYELLEEAVIEALVARAEAIASYAIEEMPTEQKKSVEALEVEGQIEQVLKLIASIGDESGVLKQKIVELKAKIPPAVEQAGDMEEMKEMLVLVGMEKDYWRKLNLQSRKDAFQWLVKAVTIDRIAREIKVELNC